MDRFVVACELFGEWVQRGRPEAMLDPYTTKQVEAREILDWLKDNPREMPPDLCRALEMPTGSTYGEAVVLLGRGMT